MNPGISWLAGFSLSVFLFMLCPRFPGKDDDERRSN